MKLQKKEVKRVFSFGIEGVNDLWEEVSTWNNFTEYRNEDNLIITTFKETSGLDFILGEMFHNTKISEENFIVGSPIILDKLKELRKKEEE